MVSNVPGNIAVLFILLTATLFVLLVAGVMETCRRLRLPNGEKQRIVGMWTVGVAVWLALLAILATRGFFADFQSMPPHIAVALAPPLLLIVGLSLAPTVRRFLLAAPETWLISFQSFRVVMELLLWWLFIAGIVPRQMTFEGRNIDVVVGLTAPLIAYLCFRRRVWSYKVAIAWNIISLLILLNIVVIALLSTPSPFRVFMNAPANTIIASFPFVWLPGFVVPVAVFGHILSIRQILLKERAHKPDVLTGEVHQPVGI